MSEFTQLGIDTRVYHDLRHMSDVMNVISANKDGWCTAGSIVEDLIAKEYERFTCCTEKLRYKRRFEMRKDDDIRGSKND